MKEVLCIKKGPWEILFLGEVSPPDVPRYNEICQVVWEEGEYYTLLGYGRFQLAKKNFVELPSIEKLLNETAQKEVHL